MNTTYNIIRESRCNCMGRVDNAWLPLRKVGDKFFTPSGFEAVAPCEFRMVDTEAIIAEMADRGEVFVQVTSSC